MKNFFTLCVAFASLTSANAQIKNDKGTFTKPGAGEWVFETQMRVDATGGALFSLNDAFLSNLSSGMSSDLVGDNFTSKNYFPMLKIRKFKSDKSVQRFGMNLSYSNNSTKVTELDPITNANVTSTDKYSDLGLAVSYGVEKHFNGAERLSTYVGLDATIGFNNISHKYTEPGNSDKQSQFGFGLGVKAFTGMDYYFIPKVYLGIELGYGLGFNTYGKVKYSTTPSNVGDPKDNGTTSNGLTLTPFVSPTFRLGYRF